MHRTRIVHCQCGVIYRSNKRSLRYASPCPACGRTPQAKHIEPSRSTQHQSSALEGIVVPTALALAGIFTLGLVLPRLFSASEEPTTALAPSQPAPLPIPSVSHSPISLPNFEEAKVLSLEDLQAPRSPRFSNETARDVSLSTLSKPALDPSLSPSPSLSLTPISLPNGTELIPPEEEQGRGNLTVNNGTSQDAVVKLVDSVSGKTIRFVYVQANNDVTIKNISSCTCLFKFSTGTNWDEKTSKFLHNRVFSQFTAPLTFDEIKREDQVQWRDYRVTLHRVVNGNAQTTSISESDFENK
ncbi:MAG TPA: hypothetical protein V6C91_14720 [Coleofasciculaceae cyanobacterium]